MRRMSAMAIAAACAAVSFLCFLIPVLVMNPFTTQWKGALMLALRLHKTGPPVSGVCAIMAAAAAGLGWNSSHSHRALAVSIAIAVSGALLTRLNVFEMLFRPYVSLNFAPPGTIALDDDSMVMSLTVAGETRAYPVGAMGYHHIANDTVGGVPVAATYCTVCHTGIVWKRLVDGRVLTFRLAGIHDGNALLRDDQTESVWQQSTGEAIYGPLKGKQMEFMSSHELSYGLWRAEHPHGRILKPVARFTSLYRNQGWEKFIEQFPAVMNTSNTGMDARELVFGIATPTASKAFPARVLFSSRLVQDRVGEEPVLLVVGPDRLSVRAFRIPAKTTFLLTGEAITDAETSSMWNFSGCATHGPRAGECLKPVDVLKEYWFDWQHCHPATEISRRED
ncbi:MAG TPA: DUF3179 domain-containing (seleno)protein [Bryobacteraceae bacterium]|nr:DUF3179 domain-containing (seleno)protein [Bryobacteraceae bacterium]